MSDPTPPPDSGRAPEPPSPPEPDSPGRAPTPSGRPWLPWVVVLLIAAGAGLILASSLDGLIYAEGSDEGFYLRYVTRVHQQGPAAFRQLFAEYVGTEQFQIFPNPLRVGFVAVGALWASGFGASFAALSKLSLASHVALVVLGFLFTRRRTSDGRAALVALLLASSPLLLALGRRALMDGFATLTGALAIWLFLELLHQPRRRGLAAGFVAALTVAILVKETSVLLLPAFAAAWVLERYAARRELPAGPLVACLALPPVLSGVTWLVASGDPSLVARVVGIVLGSPSSNPYAIQYGSGAWFRYLVDFVVLSPWPTLLAVGGFALTLARVRRGAWDTDRAFFATLAVVLLAEYSLFTKNVRYLSVLELPIAFLAVSCLHDVLGGMKESRRRLVAAIAVALVAWMGWHTFDTLFVEGGIYDPVTVNLLGVRHMIPWR